MIKRIKILIWGAGCNGKMILKKLRMDCDVLAFLDMNPSLQGGNCEGVPILSPTAIPEFLFDYVVISNIHGEEITQRLLSEYRLPLSKVIDYSRGLMLDDRIGTLRLLAAKIYARSIVGDVAEVGVYKGDFASYLNELFCDRKLYLFDTFEGFDMRDIQEERQRFLSEAQVSDYANSDIELVLSKMKNRANCIVRKGLFPETAADIHGPFCFVSLDADLYAPIRAGLEFFYERMSKGGVIMIHDYNNDQFNGCKKAVDDFTLQNELYFVEIPDACGTAILIK